MRESSLHKFIWGFSHEFSQIICHDEYGKVHIDLVFPPVAEAPVMPVVFDLHEKQPPALSVSGFCAWFSWIFVSLPECSASVLMEQLKNVPSKLKSAGIKNPCKCLTYRDFVCRVPGRTRTVDIQNHKQSCECLINPVFIGISAIFDFLFAAILRLFTQEPIFSINLEIC